MNFDELKTKFKKEHVGDLFIKVIEKCEKIHEEKLKLHCKGLVHEEVLKEYYLKIQDVKDAIDKVKYENGWIEACDLKQELFGTKEVGE